MSILTLGTQSFESNQKSNEKEEGDDAENQQSTSGRRFLHFPITWRSINPNVTPQSYSLAQVLWIIIIIIIHFFCLPATVMTLLSPPKFMEESKPSSFIVELFSSLIKKPISMVVEVCFFPYKFASSFIYWLEYLFLSPPLLPYLTFVSSLTRISQIRPSVMILPCSVMEENVWCVHFHIAVVARPLPEHTKQ